MLRTAACLLLVLGAAACASTPGPATDRYSMTAAGTDRYTTTAGQPAPLDPTRPISDRDCSKAIEFPGGNLRCQ